MTTVIHLVTDQLRYELNSSLSYNSEINFLHQVRLQSMEREYPAMVTTLTPDYYDGLVIATQSRDSLEQGKLPFVVKLNWLTSLNTSYTGQKNKLTLWKTLMSDLDDKVFKTAAIHKAGLIAFAFI